MKISELQLKEVVSVSDGRKLGKIHDLGIDLDKGFIREIIIPSETRLFGFISSGHEWVIPWRNIERIGSDVILVRIDTLSSKHGQPSTDESDISQ
ncbi:YlmC/YmxH family sporulation protein [Hazenella sp. IB182357]|uniref:YlmC/YmxH family sporulation protein n=1 Tax=Polycladospora coralii TaxID=2771432 RepID=A0A926ND04_9BACL|nr:YlmC/YmxH family sporulation protein [Polycladospora coralii]MBD1371334.1 YlmC/YmxH family sporulation protein [Polycladospora coralii]MBS7530302.1 YlmC/YmxH family sporulation protein [Polycladospora coralii]